MSALTSKTSSQSSSKPVSKEPRKTLDQIIEAHMASLKERDDLDERVAALDREIAEYEVLRAENTESLAAARKSQEPHKMRLTSCCNSVQEKIARILRIHPEFADATPSDFVAESSSVAMSIPIEADAVPMPSVVSSSASSAAPMDIPSQELSFPSQESVLLSG